MPENVKVIKVKDPTPLVTLDDPEEGVQRAAGAFCRIRVPPGLDALETQSWADLARRKAIAVKVLGAPKEADVPDDSKRIEPDVKIGTIREEALALAKETENPDVIQLTSDILDLVGIR